MMQVFDNLISDALRYTPAGGKITLRAWQVSMEDGAATGAPAGHVRITVQDTGTGIAPEELPNVFNRFHRAEKSRHTNRVKAGWGWPL